MEKEIKEKLDTAIDSAVKEAEDEKKKAEAEKEELVKRSIAFAPPQIIHSRGDKETFSYCRLIKAMASGDWRGAGFEKEAIEKVYPTPGLSNLSVGAGGYLIPEEYSTELIDLLSAEAVVRRAGASIYPMTRDTLSIPTMSAGATVYWGAEAGTKSIDTTTAFGQVQLTAKKMYCLVGISNELLADSSPAVETIVRRDMVRQMALKEDLSFLIGQANGPKGLIYQHGNGCASYDKTGTSCRIGTNVLMAGGHATTGIAGGATITYDDVLDIMYQVEKENAKVTGFIMHPRTRNSLRKIQDANGQYIYAIHPEAKVPDTLYGLPVYLTTQVGITFDDETGSGCDNLSYVLLGDWSEFIIGQRQAVELAVSEHVGFQTDSTWIRATLRVDANVKHETAFGVILDVAA